MYAKKIDTARKVVAASFAFCGLGFAAAVNLRSEGAAAILALGAIASLLAAFSLFVEYLIRVRLESRKGRGAAFQFTVAKMMVLTAIVALVLGVFRVLGGSTIVLSIAAVLFLACGVELARLPSK